MGNENHSKSDCIAREKLINPATHELTHEIEGSPSDQIFLSDVANVTDLKNFRVIPFATADSVFVHFRGHVFLHI